MSRRSPLLKCHAMAGERGTHTQPTGMMPIEVTTYEEERVGMRGQKVVLVLSERGVHGVINVWWMVQHTHKDEVGVEGKPLPEVSPWGVRE